MANAELQNLAVRYSHGQLTPEDYRQQRAQVLDAFTIDLTTHDDSPTTLRMKRPHGLAGSGKSFISENRNIVALVLTGIIIIIAGLIYLIG